MSAICSVIRFHLCVAQVIKQIYDAEKLPFCLYDRLSLN